MKKIVRLTESDLTHIVKRVLSEKKILGEQLSKHGDETVYVLKSDYVLNFKLIPSGWGRAKFNWPKTLTIKKGSDVLIDYVTTSKDSYSVDIDEKTFKNPSVEWSYALGTCGNSDIQVWVELRNTGWGTWGIYSNPTFVKNTQKLFCNGKKLKTYEEIEAFLKILSDSSKFPSFTYKGKKWFYVAHSNRFFSTSGEVLLRGDDMEITVYFDDVIAPKLKLKKTKNDGWEF